MLNAERAASPLEHLRSRFGWLMIPNVVLVVSAQVLGSMPVMIAATATCGLATALGYRGSLQVVNQIAPREPRAEVVSSYFVCGFCGNALPVIGVGILSTLTSTAAASYAPGGRFVLANKGASSGRLSSTWNISRAGSIGLERHAIFVEYIC